MKKIIAYIMLFGLVAHIGLLTGCSHSLYDKEQHYHIR